MAISDNQPAEKNPGKKNPSAEDVPAEQKPKAEKTATKRTNSQLSAKNMADALKFVGNSIDQKLLQSELQDHLKHK